MKKFILQFLHTVSFRFLLLGSIFNILLLLNYVDPYVCLGRQFFVIVGSILHYHFSQKIPNLRYISQEVEEISEVLKKKYPFLKLEPFLVVWVGLTSLGLLYIQCFSEIWAQLIFTLGCPSFVLYSAFMALKIITLIFGKDAREVFFPSASGGNPNFSVRRFSTSSKFFYFCKGCVHTCAAAGVGIWGVPKMVFSDYDYRGALFNNLTYPFTGYKSHSEWLCQQANRLWLYDHNVLPRITGPDGYLCPTLVDEEYKRTKIARPSGLFAGQVVHKPWWKS